jgi:hypothetical protein
MRKLLPYFFAFLTVVVVAMALFMPYVRLHDTKGVHEIAESVPEAVDEFRAFSGRVVLPSVDEIYVLDNSAGRDMSAFAKYLEGRAAGLHWLARSYFKTHRGAGDAALGVHLTIDSLGVFRCEEFQFSDAKDKSLEQDLREHIEFYWRYRRSTQGKTEIWFPIRWLEKYSR